MFADVVNFIFPPLNRTAGSPWRVFSLMAFSLSAQLIKFRICGQISRAGNKMSLCANTKRWNGSAIRKRGASSRATKKCLWSPLFYGSGLKLL